MSDTNDAARPLAEKKMDVEARKRRRGVVIFAALSALTSAAASLIGLILILRGGGLAAVLGLSPLVDALGVPSFDATWTFWLGLFALSLGVLEALLARALWKQQPGAYPFLVAKAALVVVYAIGISPHVKPLGAIGQLLGAVVFLRYALSREVRAMFQQEDAEASSSPTL